MLDFESAIFQAMLLVVILSAIPLGVGMLVGFIVAVLQAATQIQEQTLTFVPKLVAVSIVLFFLGGWMTEMLVRYTRDLFVAISG